MRANNTRKSSASQIIQVSRRGTPYTRLMQLNYTRRKQNGNYTSAFRSLVSTGFCQWSIMRTYWCYSGPGHEQMIVRRLPFSAAIKIEIAGRIIYPISRSRYYLTFTLPNAVRRLAYQHNPVRLLRERRKRKAWDNLWASK